MKRKSCSKCLRPTKACYCQVIKEINNQVQIIIIQHPTEAAHPFNTARMAQLCFQNLKLFKLEKIQNSPELENLIALDGSYLLFPTDESAILKKELSCAVKRLIVIDGTWRKAKKIFYFLLSSQKINIHAKNMR